MRSLALARWINTQIRTSAVQRAFPGDSRCKGSPLRGKRRPQTAPSRAQTTAGRVVGVAAINTRSCRVAYRRPAATNRRVRVIARSRRHLELTVSFMGPVDPRWYVRARVCSCESAPPDLSCVAHCRFRLKFPAFARWFDTERLLGRCQDVAATLCYEVFSHLLLYAQEKRGQD